MSEVIPYEDLLHQPEKYLPLGSKKAIRNVATNIIIDIKKLFLSDSNIMMITRSIYKIHRQNGGKSKLSKFKLLIPQLAYDFYLNNDLYEYQSADNQATGYNNWVECLKAINNDFTKTLYNILRWNAFVPTRASISVSGDGLAPTNKKMYDLTAMDKQTIDVWKKSETYVMNKQFRYNNKIPFWQTSMHNRFYDRSNEGLHENDSDRSSLESPIYAYNMSNIYDALDSYKSEDWFGI
jgi:hypothetical protein